MAGLDHPHRCRHRGRRCGRDREPGLVQVHVLPQPRPRADRARGHAGQPGSADLDHYRDRLEDHRHLRERPERHRKPVCADLPAGRGPRHSDVLPGAVDTTGLHRADPGLVQQVPGRHRLGRGQHDDQLTRAADELHLQAGRRGLAPRRRQHHRPQVPHLGRVPRVRPGDHHHRCDTRPDQPDRHSVPAGHERRQQPGRHHQVRVGGERRRRHHHRQRRLGRHRLRDHHLQPSRLQRHPAVTQHDRAVDIPSDRHARPLHLRGHAPGPVCLLHRHRLRLQRHPHRRDGVAGDLAAVGHGHHQ